MARHLRRRGVTLLAPPEGFYIRERDRRLERGEVERAVAWAIGMGEMVVGPREAASVPEPPADLSSELDAS
jgi:hypothetical protein